MSRLALGVLGLAVLTAACAPAHAQQVRQVSFPSPDGRTTLVGYLFLPDPAGGRSPAIVLMHGRSGAYSSTADGDYSAATLRRRDATWARLWASRGYVALIVDSFGPRGYPNGFGAGTYDSRPVAVNEITVRPLDAYGALAFLRAQPDVAGERIGLMGWSNGASAALATMAVNGVGSAGVTAANGFRVALAFYPGCGLDGQFDAGYRPYAPVRIFIGAADEEVSPASCQKLADRNAALGGGVDLTVYPGATHDFDDPGNHRQDNPANVAASQDAVAHAIAVFDAALRP
jgi:carboxymethylenebutenolidase